MIEAFRDGFIFTKYRMKGASKLNALTTITTAVRVVAYGSIWKQAAGPTVTVVHVAVQVAVQVAAAAAVVVGPQQRHYI